MEFLHRSPMEVLQERQTDRSRECLVVVEDGKNKGPRAMKAWCEASQHAGGLVSHVLERRDLAAIVRIGVKCDVNGDCSKVLVLKGIVQRVKDLGHGPDGDGLVAKILAQPLDCESDELSTSGVADGDALGDGEVATHGCWMAGRCVLGGWTATTSSRFSQAEFVDSWQHTSPGARCYL